MIVLGITDSFTSGAAIVVDGQLVAAVSEERLDRNKMSMGFPNRSIVEVLRLANVRPHEVAHVAVASSNLFWRPQTVPYSDYFREKKGGLRGTFLGLGSLFSTIVGDVGPARQVYHGMKQALTRTRRKAIPRLLAEQFGISAPVRFLDHHLCHAASTYFTAGFPEATIVTQDGAGDGKCSRVYAVRNGKFKLLQSLDSYDSVGNYYSYVTHICGFKAHKHEGKITGLAAYGEPEFLDLLESMIHYDGRTIRNAGRSFDMSAIRRLEMMLPRGFSHANLAASVQALLEKSVTAYCDHWVKSSGLPNLALAGGVFANVKLNQRVHELPSTSLVFVHPGMGDEGLGVGAALFWHATLAGFQSRPVIGDVYLGGDVTGFDVKRAISAEGLRVSVSGHGVTEAVARLLADGKVVARCAGRMEYGPRALGNRTIMYQTTDPAVNKWLNERLSRTEFMPFAPVTLWQYRHECYEKLQGAEETARFMTITFNCTPKMRQQSPAVCHVDNTARPQLIRERDNPAYYAIVRRYHEITGIPSLVNTSFNIHDEPIVHTASEAIKAFRQSHLDALVVGDCLVLAPAVEVPRKVVSA